MGSCMPLYTYRESERNFMSIGMKERKRLCVPSSLSALDIASLVVKQSGHCFAVSLFGVSDRIRRRRKKYQFWFLRSLLSMGYCSLYGLSALTGSQRNIVKHFFKRVIRSLSLSLGF